ncbi:MAG: signal peptidase I [Lachnospiraceae bacterium]|nr:signal peptidase I [Lachnospiraceae bacterium]
MEFDYDFERVERAEKFKKRFWAVFRMALAIALAILAAWAITRYALEKTDMVGNSMAPTLSDKDIILINKLAYIRKQPKRFDVIVFELNGREHRFYCIRRVIGLPGEQIKIEDGVVYINGEALDEPIMAEPAVIEGLARETITLDEDEYFVLGDNRNDSEDSRFAHVGNVVDSQIIGRAWLRLSQFGFISRLNQKEDIEENGISDGKEAKE